MNYETAYQKAEFVGKHFFWGAQATIPAYWFVPDGNGNVAGIGNSHEGAAKDAAGRPHVREVHEEEEIERNEP